MRWLKVYSMEQPYAMLDRLQTLPITQSQTVDKPNQRPQSWLWGCRDYVEEVPGMLTHLRHRE